MEALAQKMAHHLTIDPVHSLYSHRAAASELDEISHILSAELIDGERDRDAIVSQLERMHGGNPEIAADTDAFLADLRQAGLVG